MKIKKIFIANRGEIVCRIARTASRLGIHTCGALTPQDFHTAAARNLQEAAQLPPGDLSDNYLNAELLISHALRFQAQAVHPGYGFLSENPDFAEQVQSAGLIWIGPPAHAMRELGGKIRAKEVATKAGVPIAPWRQIGGSLSPKEIKDIVREIGLPVLIKAAHGGGGRGQRIVRETKEFEDALKSARSEALRSFGSDEVFVERFLDHPRHIEVQIIADSHGHYAHLGERDCTLQRRNQKVIEETPAVILDDVLRSKIQESAVSLAKSVGYTNAGTIEFLAQNNKKAGWEYFFMEMNARLQVEHTVTEEVWGVDLVEYQIRIAQGDDLEKEFAALSGPSGHAIEVRLCAEDPQNHFLPTPGPILDFAIPSKKSLRVDSGYDAGDIVPQEYDSLVAKLVYHSPNRKEAIQNLTRLLDGSIISGIITNKFFLKDLLSHSDFDSNQIYTRWIEDHPELTKSSNFLDEDLGYWGRKWSSELFVQRKITTSGARLRTYEMTGQKYLTEFQPSEEHGSPTNHGLVRIAGTFRLENGTSVYATGWINRFELCITFAAEIHGVGQRRIRFLGELEVEDVRTHHGPIVSQVPGVVLDIRSKVNDVVDARAPILIIEAMKMEMPMSLPVAAKITSIHVKPGDRIQPGQTLITWEPL